VERARDAGSTVRRLWGYLARRRRALLGAAALIAISTGLNLAGPYLLGQAIDRYVVPHDLPGLARICLLMLAVYGLASLVTWLQSYVMAGVAQDTVRDIRDDLFARLQRLPLRYFDQRERGDLMSRLTNDVENVNLVLTESLAQLASGVLGLIGVAAVMLWLNPVLAAVSVATISLLSLGLSRWVASRTREAFRQQQAALGTLNGLIEETVTGQRVVKAYHREATVTERFDDLNRGVRRAATQAQIYAGFVGPLMNFVGKPGPGRRRRGRGLAGGAGYGHCRHHRQLRLLHPPVRAPAERDGQPLQRHPGGGRGG
jgi:ATP-binding cassette subfamily B protein